MSTNVSILCIMYYVELYPYTDTYRSFYQNFFHWGI